jgi:hypothetical protein
MAFPDTPLIAKVLKRHLCEWLITQFTCTG